MTGSLRGVRTVWAAAVVGLGLLACSGSTGEGDPPAAEGGYVECIVPRPEVCSGEALPVCALRDTGVRCVTEPCDTWETKTFTNACTACADRAVYGWRPGACESEGVVRRAPGNLPRE